MRDVVTEDGKARERVRQYLRQCYFDSLPYLDRAIPLGKPALEGDQKIKAYFQAKHAAGNYGRFWPLHKTAPAPFGAMRSMRDGGKRMGWTGRAPAPNYPIELGRGF
jgi:hypothetical protein